MQSGKLVGTIALANKPSGYDRCDQEAVEALAPVIVAALTQKRTQALLRQAQHDIVRQDRLAILTQLAGDSGRARRGWLRALADALRLHPGRTKTGACDDAATIMRSPRQGSRSADLPRTVLLTSPRRAFREAVTCALNDLHNTTVIEAADLEDQGLRIARDTNPDVVIVDLGSAAMGTYRAVALLRQQLPDAKIVAAGPYNTKSVRHTARECGADELVLGATEGRRFVEAIRTAVLTS